MANYHPLDVRYKPKTHSGQQLKTQPWRITEPKVEPWQRKGPIQDDPRTEQRKQEKHARKIEGKELRKIPLIAILFSPALLFYQGRALLRSKSAAGYSTGQIALQVIAAVVIYFVLFKADTTFGINELLVAPMN